MRRGMPCVSPLPAEALVKEWEEEQGQEAPDNVRAFFNTLAE